MNITGIMIYHHTSSAVSVLEMDGAPYPGDTLLAGLVENLGAYHGTLARCPDWLPDGTGGYRRLSPAQARAHLLDKVERYIRLDADNPYTGPMERRALEAKFGPAAVEAAIRALEVA